MTLPGMSAGYKNSLLGESNSQGCLSGAENSSQGERLAGFKRTGRRMRGVGREDWYLAQGVGREDLSLICS